MIKKISPLLFVIFVTCLMFFKIFSKGLYPVPGDLLVSFYFPYYSGGWEGYNPWTTRKELLGSDSIRQIYLWKEFAAREFQSGKFPLWNPFTFAGQPLLANFQSSVFYPFNVFYFLFDSGNAWILLIVLQPILGGLFMYLATRSFNLSKISSLFASVSFIFSSYFVTWMENGNITHSYVWLPLAFWSINNYFLNAQARYLLILSLSLSLSIFAGHPQTAIYIFIISVIYWIYKVIESKKKQISSTVILLLVLFFAVSLTAIQLLPTVSFYRIAPISFPLAREVFDRSMVPPLNLITFFASDFFGHPANNNFWSFSYGDLTPYFGVIPLVLTFWAVYRFWKNKFTKFALITSLIFILAAIEGPITYIIKYFQIPIINATTPSRFISISIFLLIILSAFGLDDVIKNLNSKKYIKKMFVFLAPIALIYSAMWLFAITADKFLPNSLTWQTNLSVTRRNLILPTLMFLFVPFSLVTYLLLQRIFNFKTLFKNLFLIGIFTVTILGGVYYSNKFLPVAPKNYIFPDHPLFTWLKNNGGINRFYGGGTAHIDFNFPTHYQIYGSEGYDTLRIGRYAELIASSGTGKVPETYPRSDAALPNEENGYRRRVFDLLGIKYLLDKNDEPKDGGNFEEQRFAQDQVRGRWQEGKFLIYERPTALPRVFTTTNYQVSTDSEIIKNIYNPDFDLKTLLLEKEPPLNLKNQISEVTEPKIIKYDPGSIILETNTQNNSLLFVSDAHEKDWQVMVDGQKSELQRAHYAFLSVAIPAGNHNVAFKYDPKSFRLGLYTTVVTLFALVGLSYFLSRTKRL